MPSGQRTLVISGGIDPILSQLRVDTPIEIVSAVIPVTARSAVDFGFVGNLEIGETASVGADGAIAIGGRGAPRAVGADSIAIGSGLASPNNGPLAAGSRAIAIGTGATADGPRAVAIGNTAIAGSAVQTDTVAIGTSASAQGGADCIAIGNLAQAGGLGQGIAIGRQAMAGFGIQNIAIGRQADAQGDRSIAIGPFATMQGGAQENVVIGDTASTVNAGTNQAVAIGNAASVMALQGIAIGDGASATVANEAHIASNTFVLGRGVTRNRVLRPRITGWGAPTGTATRTAFDTATVTLAGLAERVKALLDDLGMVAAGHGIIGT